MESDWEYLQQFFMWSYSSQHMNIRDADAAHCATYALGWNCGHGLVGAYERCKILLELFDTPFAYFFNAIVLKQLNDDQI